MIVTFKSYNRTAKQDAMSIFSLYGFLTGVHLALQRKNIQKIILSYQGVGFAWNTSPAAQPPGEIMSVKSVHCDGRVAGFNAVKMLFLN